MKKFKAIIIPTVVLTLICGICAAGLGFTNSLTAKRIENSQTMAEEKAMKRIISADSYSKKTYFDGTKSYEYNLAASESGDVLGYIITTTANGYGGQVRVMVGIGSDSKIKAIEVVDVSSETPGLGQNANNKTFWSEFEGKESGVGVAKSNPSGNQVMAITGATITSKAVASCINNAFEIYEKITREGGV